MIGEEKLSQFHWGILHQLVMVGGITPRKDFVTMSAFNGRTSSIRVALALADLLAAGFIETDHDTVCVTKLGGDAAYEWIPF